MRAVSGKVIVLTRHYSFFIIYLGFVLLLAACSSAQVLPTPSSTGTGIAVNGRFTDFYNANGGRRVFGDPITDGFTAPDDGRFTQYFQAMRLEYDETAHAVTVYPLGEWALGGLHDATPVAVSANSPSRYFPAMDLTVQDEFLSFYETYHGEQLLGPPISSQLDVDDLRVQYFQNGRLEWHPELPIGQRIQVGYLGVAHFDAQMSFFYRPNQLAQPVSSAGIERVNVFTSVGTSVLYAGDTQTLYVTVLSPEGNPISDIAATVTALVDDAPQATIDLGRTDKDGHIVIALPDLAVPPGKQVVLQTAVANSGGVVVGESTSAFKTWW